MLETHIVKLIKVSIYTCRHAFKASIFTCTEQTPLVSISETNKYHYMTKKYACDYKNIFHNMEDSTTVEHIQDVICTWTFS